VTETEPVTGELNEAEANELSYEDELDDAQTGGSRNNRVALAGLSRLTGANRRTHGGKARAAARRSG